MQGKITERVYDSVGRLSIDRILNYGGAYTRYEYPTNGVQAKKFITIVDEDEDGADSSDEVLSESWSDGAGRVLRSRTEHPGSIGGWSATLAVYDLLGRPAKQSVPTEVDANWNPAGDDATRGFLWTYQKYDWKGRVVRKINTDGIDSSTLNDSDILISYEGCGCAGGQITTIEGELVPRDDISGTGRRKQKIYEDILGRTWKTETFEWDGTTIYSTIASTFNGRDQVALSRHFAGDVTSSTYQDTTASFDGFGRLMTSHRPEQRDDNDNLKYTTHNYNPDGSISSVTDGRGATTNFEYNSRGLLANKSWTVPAGSSIVISPAVEFNYDATGNRLGMTDGQGRVDYEYDQLSRMTGEKREFNHTVVNAPLPSNGFRLSYTYDLTDQLKSITDPFGSTISYDQDRRGRLIHVSGTSYGGTMNYAANAQYRAWSGLKKLEYGDNRKMEVDFNKRQQAISYDLSDLSGNTRYIQRTYEHYSDGRLRSADNPVDQKWDRWNRYDHIGRIKEARSGIEASGQTETDMTKLPYRQTYSYDAFGHPLGRANLNWGESFNYAEGPFTNNRSSSIGLYDADGRAISGDAFQTEYEINGHLKIFTREQIYQYEASGQMSVNSDQVKIETITYDPNTPGTSEDFEGSQLTPYYDGDGRTVRVSGWDAHGTEAPREIVPRIDVYSIRSSVLGGKVVSEYKAYSAFGGRKFRTIIYAGGTAIAFQTYWNNSEKVLWNYADPQGTWRREDWGHTPTHFGKELDPLGSDVGADHTAVEPASLEQPEMNHQAGGFGFDVDPSELSGPDGRKIQCIVDGIRSSCNNAWMILRGGYGNVVQDESDRYAMAMLGLQEVRSRVPVFGQPNGRVRVYDEKGRIDFDDGGGPTGPSALIGYRQEVSWEMQEPDVPTYGGMNSEKHRSAFLYEPKEDCKAALNKANQGIDAYYRGWALKGELQKASDTYGTQDFARLFDGAMLAAIATRETGVNNIAEKGGKGKNGKGIFQITTGQVSQAVLDSPELSAKWILDNKLAPEYNRHTKHGRDIAFFASLRNYNAGSATTANIIKQVDKNGGINATKNDFDYGTAYPGLDINKAPKDNNRGNYVSNVLDLARYCYGWQGISR